MRSFLFIAITVFFSFNMMPSYAQEMRLVKTASGVGLYSYLTGEHIWEGPMSDEYASGDGKLTIYAKGSWTGRLKELTIVGEMYQGNFLGSAESYFYSQGLYWFGAVRDLHPDGCGVGGNLAPNGGRIESSFEIQMWRNNKRITDSSNTCEKNLESLIAGKIGQRLGSQIIKCVAAKRPNCFSGDTKTKG